MNKLFRPRLETLEDRLALAGGGSSIVMQWHPVVPLSNLEFTNPLNWDNKTNANDHHVPLNNENIEFNGNVSNWACYYHGGALTTGSVLFTSAYTNSFYVYTSTTGWTINGELKFDVPHDGLAPNGVGSSAIHLLGAAPILGIANATLGGNSITVPFDKEGKIFGNDSGAVPLGQMWVSQGWAQIDGKLGLMLPESFFGGGTGGVTVNISQYGEIDLSGSDSHLTIQPGAFFNFTGNAGPTAGGMVKGLGGTPFVYNFGYVNKLDTGIGIFRDVSFHNAGDLSSVRLTNGAELDFTNHSDTRWAFWQYGNHSLTSIQNNCVLYTQNFNNGDLSAWAQRGVVFTLDFASIVGQTAWWNSPYVRFGDDNDWYLMLDITHASAITGYLRNSFGGYSFKYTAITKVSISNGNVCDQIWCYDHIWMDGILQVEWVGAGNPAFGSVWEVLRADANQAYYQGIYSTPRNVQPPSIPGRWQSYRNVDLTRYLITFDSW